MNAVSSDPSGNINKPRHEDPADVERALQAASCGGAGHWPTVATILRNEVLRLRSVSVGCAVTTGDPVDQGQTTAHADTSVAGDLASEIDAHLAVIAGFAVTARDRQWSDDRIREAIGEALRSWLAGRMVVDLPEPDRVWSDGAPLWQAESRSVTAEVDNAGRPYIRLNGQIWLDGEAEAVALAMLAAVATARQQATQSSGVAGGDTR